MFMCLVMFTPSTCSTLGDNIYGQKKKFLSEDSSKKKEMVKKKFFSEDSSKKKENSEPLIEYQDGGEHQSNEEDVTERNT